MSYHSNIKARKNPPEIEHPTSRKYLKIFLFILLLMASGYLLYMGDLKLRDIEKNSLPVIGAEQAHTVSQFSFLNQEGKVITNEYIKGKICVVSYFFATCKGICPQMNENMDLVYKAFNGNENVVLLSHTVDPKKDSVGALKAYSKRYDANPVQWMFLTGDKKKLYDMARYSYLISAGDDTTGLGIDCDFIHDQQFTLVDGYGRIRGIYDGLNKKQIDSLIGDIKRLLNEKKVQ